jgi:hypothetical protein
VTSNGRKSKTEEMYIYTNGSAVKNPPANAGDADLIPGSEDHLDEKMANALQYSCLGNTTDKGVWRPIAHGITKSRT